MNDKKNNTTKAACSADPDNPENSSNMGSGCDNHQSNYLNEKIVGQQKSKTTFMASYNIWGIFYGVIYIIIDTANCKVYIGQTIRSLKKRFRDHLTYPSNRFLKQAFERYGYKLKIQKVSASAEKICTIKGEFIIFSGYSSHP